MNKHFFLDLELIKKDARQWAAFQSSDSTVMIAGPGSGKTRVLSLKAVSLKASAIHAPSGLACISYSRETVRELKKRLRQYGFKENNYDFIGTIHSFSLLHILKPFAHLFPGYNVRYPIKILPKEIENQIYDGVLSKLKKERRDLSLTEIKRYRSLSFDGRSKITKPASDLVKAAAILFEDAVRGTEYLDFISVINISAKLIHEQPLVRKTLEAKFPWLLIDEYQDLGKALHEMVLELFSRTSMKIYAVGDMNQSIYGFNGGYPEFLKELSDQKDITTIPLEANYRSSQHIIDASIEALIPTSPAPRYVARRRQDEADFAFITCQEDMEPQYAITATKAVPCLLNAGVQINEIAIIVASNAEVRHMGRYLQNAGIPFYVVKWEFENSNVVVWLQDCAGWCINRHSQSFDLLFKNWNSLLVQHGDAKAFKDKIRLKVEFYQILTSSSNIGLLWQWLEYIIEQTGLKDTLKDSEQFPNEIKNLDLLIAEAKTHNLKDAPLNRFSKLNRPEHEVTITTRHSAKGLEFEAVIMLGMEEGRFPDYRHSTIEIEEDQRLCYVCVSRAKKNMHSDSLRTALGRLAESLAKIV